MFERAGRRIARLHCGTFNTLVFVPERRQVNENRRHLFGNDERIVAFLCECADQDCYSAVMLTGVQADEAWATHGWIVAPGHDPIEDAADTNVVVPFPLDDR